MAANAVALTAKGLLARARRDNWDFDDATKRYA